jgi:hypothetical protein
MNRIISAIEQLATDANLSGLDAAGRLEWLQQQPIAPESLAALVGADRAALNKALGITAPYLCVLFPKDDGKSPQKDEEEEISSVSAPRTAIAA